MNDDELIDAIAELWVASGGDKEGVYYIVPRLIARIAALVESAKQMEDKPNV